MIVNEEQFYANKVVDENGCWIWQGKLKTTGYGRLMWEGEDIGAHRLSLGFNTGIMPEGMHACHKPDVCLSKACINPDHLYWGTPRQNGMDKKGMEYKKRDSCKRGHLKTERKKHRVSDTCPTCEKLIYMAKKLARGKKLSRTNLKNLREFGLSQDEVNWADYYSGFQNSMVDVGDVGKSSMRSLMSWIPN